MLWKKIYKVRIKLFLLNLAVLYPFSFRAWARVLCVIKTSAIKAFPFQSYCICRFLITGNSMHCNRLLKHPCYCTYNFMCSLFQSSRLDIFQSLWLTSSIAVTSLCLCFLLIFYFMQSGTDTGSSCFVHVLMSKAASFVELFSSILCRASVWSQFSSWDLESFPSFPSPSSLYRFFIIAASFPKENQTLLEIHVPQLLQPGSSWIRSLVNF